MDFAAFVMPDEALQLQDQLPAVIEAAQLGDPEGAYQAAEITGQIVQILTPYAWGAAVAVSLYLFVTRTETGKRGRRAGSSMLRKTGAFGRVVSHPIFKAGAIGAAAAFLWKFWSFKKSADSWALAASDMAQLASQNQPAAVIEA